MSKIRTIRIKNKEIRELLDFSDPSFPKYTTQLMNLANQNSGATKPRIVGQMTDLIREFPGRNYEEWEKWYSERYPNAIDNAISRIRTMLNNLAKALEEIDDDLISLWVKDLVLVKTYVGLRFQRAIIKRVADSLSLNCQLETTPEEEAKGIDGYIGEVPVSVKPITYKVQSQRLSEDLSGIRMIYYQKQKDCIEVEYEGIP